MSFRRSLALVFAIGVVILVATLRATDGRPSLPLDDSFIYFQYAKQAAAGQPLVYQTGDAPTTGSTSLPWMAALALGSLLGFGGKAIIFFAMVAGGVLLAWTVVSCGRAAEGIDPALAGETLPWIGAPLASALVLVSGPLHWGSWSGMEIPLFAAAIAWAFAQCAADGGAPSLRGAISLALLATVRPEGSLLAIVAVGLQAVRLVRGRTVAGAWLLLIPLLAVLVQPLVNVIATGEARSTGFLAKSLLGAAGADPLAVLRIAVLRAASLSTAVLGGIGPFADGLGLYAYESEAARLFVAPGAALLFLIGVLPACAGELREGRPGAGILTVAWIATIFVATCILEEPDAHFSRYQMPVLPVFLVFVAIGVGRIAAALAGAGGGLGYLAAGLRGWLVLFGLVSVGFFTAAFADNSEDIDRMQIRLGESLAVALDPGSVIAINDAGALTYFSGHRTLDLIGLTSPGLAGLWGQGTGVLYEKLESLPPTSRPGWFAFFPNWFEFEGLGLLRRRGSVRLLSPSIVDAEKVVAAADWSLAGSGDVPRLVPAELLSSVRVVDRLDVADVDSEREHDFRRDDLQKGSASGSFVRRAVVAQRPEEELIDGGRSFLGVVEFAMARDALRSTALVVRSVTGARQRVLVSIDGASEHEVEIHAPGSGRFHEQIVARLPAGSGPARVRMRVTPEAAGSTPLILAHVFTLAGLPE